MAMTARELILRLIRAIDPYTKDGDEITVDNIGTNGDRFTYARIVDIYNQARTVLAGELINQGKAAGENCTSTAGLTFLAGAAEKPAGYLRKILLTDRYGTEIPILDPEHRQSIRDLGAGDNPAVVETGIAFEDPSGGAYVPNDGAYRLDYYGITPHATTAITDGSAAETFGERWHHILIEIAQAISREQGSRELNALAKTLIGANTGPQQQAEEA